MKIILFALIFISTINTNAQMGTWKIKLNTKEIVSTAKEDMQTNWKKLESSVWGNPGTLEISFKENDPDAWLRTFLFYDEYDKSIFSTDSTTKFSISLEKLRSLYKGKKSMIIYTVVSPTDPNIAIRMRRVHLYTFKLP
ncbi:MAG: hypothetical protein ABIP79_10060 [Chitinophagaceae bacterium]